MVDAPRGTGREHQRQFIRRRIARRLITEYERQSPWSMLRAELVASTNDSSFGDGSLDGRSLARRLITEDERQSPCSTLRAELVASTNDSSFGDCSLDGCSLDGCSLKINVGVHGRCSVRNWSRAPTTVHSLTARSATVDRSTLAQRLIAEDQRRSPWSTLHAELVASTTDGSLDSVTLAARRFINFFDRRDRHQSH